MKAHHWNVTESCFIELFRDGSQVFDGTKERVVPDGLARYVTGTDDLYELELQFTSEGSYQPASMYGGPDRLGWPEDYSEDRTLEAAYVHTHLSSGRLVSKVPPALAEELFEFFRDDVNAVELPERED